MPLVFEVSSKDISDLNANQLPELLRYLLIGECRQHNLAVTEIHVPENICHPDGGEDGRIKLQTAPPDQSQLRQLLTGFQATISPLTAAECAKKILQEHSTRLQPQVEEILKAGGEFILILNKDLTKQDIQSRLKQMCEAISKSGTIDADIDALRILDANQLRDWTNQHITAVIAVQGWLGKPSLPGLMTWKEWSNYQEHSTPFISSATLTRHIQTLQDTFQHPKQVARIIGFAGLGKTRLALETFKPPIDPSENRLSKQIVYFDLKSNQATTLISHMHSWRRNHMNGILVVDNCPLELHNQLKNEVQHLDNRLSLLTIFPLAEEHSNTQTITIDKMAKAGIQGMLQQTYPHLSEAELTRLVEFAWGYPRIAVMLAQARLQGEQHLDQILDDDLMRRMLGDAATGELNQTLKVCSLFEKVYFNGEKLNEYALIAKEIAKLEPDSFYRCVIQLIDKRLINQAGRYIRVEPLPLAVRLAADWWKECTQQTAKQLITANTLTEPLIEALCTRMQMLDNHPKAQALVRDLCGSQGPFGQAELLNTERGSRLFRLLSEVNPDAALNALERAFGDLDQDQLLMIKAGRRNIIWTLEKLCFPDQWFPRAARLMMAFATAETESFSNNATGLFTQLFDTWTSSTEAPPAKRFPILDEALNSQDEQRRHLAIAALSNALESHSINRMSQAERMGSGPPRQNWQPTIWDEAFEYWRQALQRLTQAALQGDDVAQKARTAIAHHTRKLLWHGRVDDLNESIQTIVQHHGTDWPELHEAINNALQYDLQEISADIKQQIMQWQSLLTPTHLEERLKRTVSLPLWSDFHIDDENGQIINRASLQAQQLAEELAMNFPEWVHLVPNICQGEQRQAATFGQRLGETLENPLPFIQTALNALGTTDNQNPSVLAACLKAVRTRNEPLVEDILSQAAANKKWHPVLIDLTRLSYPTISDLERVWRLAEQKILPVNQMNLFAYGSVLAHIEPDTINQLSLRLANISPEGAWIALDIIFMYLYGHNEHRWEPCRSTLRQLLMHPNLIFDATINQGWCNHWRDITKKLLAEKDTTLADHVMHTILNRTKNAPYYMTEIYQAVLFQLFKIQFDTIWPMVTKTSKVDDPMYKYHLTQLLGNSHRNEETPGPLFTVPPEKLLHWCQQDPEHVPALIAEIMPLLHHDTSHPWSTFSQTLITKYGHQENVLHALDTNLGTFMISWSSIPKLNQEKNFLSLLRNHQHQAVRHWASERLDYVEKRLTDEQNNKKTWNEAD